VTRIYLDAFSFIYLVETSNPFHEGDLVAINSQAKIPLIVTDRPRRDEGGKEIRTK
jgi:hypothetical protein